MKSCKDCFEEKKPEEFPICRRAATAIYRKNRCKPCFSLFTQNKAQEKRIELYPNKYVQCEECLHIRHIDWKGKCHCDK